MRGLRACRLLLLLSLSHAHTRVWGTPRLSCSSRRLQRRLPTGPQPAPSAAGSSPTHLELSGPGPAPGGRATRGLHAALSDPPPPPPAASVRRPGVRGSRFRIGPLFQVVFIIFLLSFSRWRLKKVVKCPCDKMPQRQEVSQLWRFCEDSPRASTVLNLSRRACSRCHQRPEGEGGDGHSDSGAGLSRRAPDDGALCRGGAGRRGFRWGSARRETWRPWGPGPGRRAQPVGS